jgi:outer membrane protein
MTRFQYRRGRVARWSSAGVGALLAGLGASDASAESALLSRGAAVAMALEQNPRIAAAAALEGVAQAHRGQARAAGGPSLTAALATGPSLRAKLVPGSGTASTENAYGDVGLADLSVVVGARLELAQPLYTFGKISERVRAAEHELRARRAETALTRAEVALRVAQMYEGLLFARDADSFFDEMEHWLSRTIEDTRGELQSGGDATEQDVSRLEAALSAARLGRHQAQATYRQAEVGLLAYLSLPTGSLPLLAERGLEPLPVELPDSKTLIALALDHRPELVALREGQAAYGALARAEAAGNLPDFFALAFASGAYTPGRDIADSRYVQDPLGGFYPGLLVGARWQLTLGMPRERANEQRALASQLAELERFARTGIPAEVLAAGEDVRRAKADMDEARKGVSSAKSWMVRAEADDSVGLGEAREVTDAARAYVELRLAYFDAVYRHNVGLATLARATGTLDAAPAGLYPTTRSDHESSP